MFAIVGLGNPGMQYTATRHNIGFEVIERLAYDHHINLNKKKHKAILGEGTIKGEKVVLIQPQTYMNASGESVIEVIKWYKLPLDHLIVVYDDISLPVGGLRIRTKGSAGGHNGIKNIIAHTGTEAFPRVRVGIGEKPPGWDLARYVLSRFGKEEMEEVISMVKEASEAVETFISEGIESAMNKYNQRKKG